MRIGILTQPLHNNYGGLLQNYALQQTLFRMGHKVETIDWRSPKVNPIKEKLWRFKEYILCLLNTDRQKPPYNLTEDEYNYISKENVSFISNHINVCPIRANKEADFAEIEKKYQYDAYIVGSDQVWRPSYNSMLGSMFLDFVSRKEVKRIAYAASFGTNEWEFSPLQAGMFSKLVQRFNLVTVRETSGIALCKNYFGVDAIQVMDPTLLLQKEDYENLVAEHEIPKSGGDLFYYILDPSYEIKSIIELVAKKQKYTLFTVLPKRQAENRTKSDVKNRIDDCVYPSLVKWLRGFMDAKMIIVDSFHGAVFSIIFNKPFWVIGNSKRGNARFESLLSLFHLEERLISLSSVQDIDLDSLIDWNKVNKIKENEKARCTELLRDALE